MVEEHKSQNYTKSARITVVDFSVDDMVKYEFDNLQLIEFLEKKQQDWIKCRWINVNGFSWDLYKHLERTTSCIGWQLKI